MAPEAVQGSQAVSIAAADRKVKPEEKEKDSQVASGSDDSGHKESTREAVRNESGVQTLAEA